MPTCRQCNFSQNLGEFIQGFCNECLEKELNFLKEQFEQQNNELVRLRTPRQNPTLSRQIQDKEAQIAELQEGLDKYAEEIRGRQGKITQLEQNLTNSQTENQEKERIRVELTQQKQALETQLSSKTTELNQELSKTQQLQQNLTNLQTQKNTNENNLKQEIKVKESELQKTLIESKESTATLRQEIEGLKKNLQESKEINQKELQTEQNKLKELESKLNEQIAINQQKEQSIGQLKTNLENSEKALKDTKQSLIQSQQKITQLETQILNHEQLKEKHLTRIEELQKELSQSQVSNEQLSNELTQTKETLSVKVEQLKKVRLEVVGLQSRLKSMPKPEPVKPVSTNTQPINPWIIGIILVAGIGLFLLLNRRRE